METDVENNYLLWYLYYQITAPVSGTLRKSHRRGACSDLSVAGAELQGQGEEPGHQGVL